MQFLEVFFISQRFTSFPSANGLVILLQIFQWLNLSKWCCSTFGVLKCFCYINQFHTSEFKFLRTQPMYISCVFSQVSLIFEVCSTHRADDIPLCPVAQHVFSYRRFQLKSFTTNIARKRATVRVFVNEVFLKGALLIEGSTTLITHNITQAEV